MGVCQKPLFFMHALYSIIVQLCLQAPLFFVHAQNSIMESKKKGATV